MTFLEYWILDETNGLKGIFEKYRRGVPEQPIEIKTVLTDFIKPVTPTPAQLPAVSFSFGSIDEGLGPASSTSTVRELFSVVIHITVNLGTSTSMISRISNMTNLIFLVIKELQMTAEDPTDPQFGGLHNVIFGGMINNSVGSGDQSRLEYVILFDYERM